MLLTQEKLKTIFHYDPETGIFTRFSTGKVVGSPNTKGCIQINIGHSKYVAARLAWMYMTGKFPEHFIDHKNMIKSDNRWENLREATNSQNRANTDPTADSNYKGVYPNRYRWKAVISMGGKHVYLGNFRTKQEAAEAYRVAARKHFGEFMRAP